MDDGGVLGVTCEIKKSFINGDFKFLQLFGNPRSRGFKRL